MKILEIAKLAAEVVVSFGVSAVVGNAIKAGTPENAKVYKKVAIGIGGFVLSSIAAEHASRYATESIDGIADRVTQVVSVVDKLKSGPGIATDLPPFDIEYNTESYIPDEDKPE